MREKCSIVMQHYNVLIFPALPIPALRNSTSGELTATCSCMFLANINVAVAIERRPRRVHATRRGGAADLPAIHPRDPLLMFKDMLRIRWDAAWGRYDVSPP